MNISYTTHVQKYLKNSLLKPPPSSAISFEKLIIAMALKSKFDFETALLVVVSECLCSLEIFWAIE